MSSLRSRLRPFMFYAAAFSFFVNLLLLTPPLYMLQVFDRVITSRHGETLALLTLAAAGALAAMAFLDVLRGRLLAGAAIVMDKALGPQVIERLLAAAARRSAAQSLHGLKDVNALRTFMTGPGIFALFDAPWLPGYLLLIYLFHPFLGLIATVGAVLMVLLALLNERLTRERLEANQIENRRAGRFIDISTRNAEAISAMGMLGAVVHRWEGLNAVALRALAQTSETGGLVSGATKLTRQLIQVAMLGGGAWLVVDQHVTSGVMMAATIILGRALAPVEMLVAGWRSLVDARSALGRLEKLLAEESPGTVRTELPAPAGRLAAETLVYRVPGRDAPILRGVSFQLAEGESLGLIGPSASGKSTLARLIVGIWAPVGGVMRLDGADVSQWPREQLGQCIGYLPQDVELFPGTVADNICRLGEPDSAAVVRAAQRAFCHDMILRLPKGYDTELGESGMALSPGQQQRIGLARALYGEPRLVVLDEPNSNLDGEGEEALQSALRELRAARVTVVVIAHRPSLLASMDKLLVLRAGAVDVFGPREEVMSRVAPRAAAAKRTAAG
jgi:ATP-binding cassette subfamily C exporter for protease/lipase/ATP-binding cassette subfamily C protein EexD